MRSFKVVVFAMSLCFGSTAQAVPIDFDIDYFNDIWSQDAFGDTPVDIRFGPTQELVSQPLSNITFPDELETLWALNDNRPQLNLYLVDGITLGFPFPIAGIAEFTPTGPIDFNTFLQPGIWGNSLALDRDLTTGAEATRTLAHEIGHTLGLFHEGERDFFLQGRLVDNLMNPRASSDRLTPVQVATMLASPYMQGNAQSGFFVEVNVFDVVTEPSITPVPLPASGWMLLAGLGAMYAARRARVRPKPA